jgi:hypothetical protein
MVMKTCENPETKKNVERNTFFRMAALRPCVSCSSENPVIKVKYAGISGNTHGERNDRSPAMNAAG